MSEKLLSCPFCGGEEINLFTRDGVMRYYWYECAKCYCGTGHEESEAEAIAAWNRRAQPENARQHALQTGVCPMCEDCPDGCPVEAPNDSRNRPENEPLTLEELRGMENDNDGTPIWI